MLNSNGFVRSMIKYDRCNISGKGNSNVSPMNGYQ